MGYFVHLLFSHSFQVKKLLTEVRASEEGEVQGVQGCNVALDSMSRAFFLIELRAWPIESVHILEIKRFNLLDLIQELASCNDMYLQEAGENEICELFVDANKIITVKLLLLL